MTRNAKTPHSPAAREKPKASAASEPLSYEEAFTFFTPAANALDPQAVVPCKANVRVAAANVKHAFLNVFGDPAKDPAAQGARVAFIEEHLPKIPTGRLLSLVNLSRAVVFASLRVVRRPASPGEVQKKIDIISTPREDFLSMAEVLATRGKLDKDQVAGIRAGSGKYDMAADVVALVHLYRKSAKDIAGKHPFTEEEFDKALVAAEWLLNHLTPEGAHAPKATTTSDAQDMLNRLWTLLTQAYADLRKVGYILAGDDFEEMTPKLQSRVAGVVIEDPPAEDPPAPAPGAATPQPSPVKDSTA